MTEDNPALANFIWNIGENLEDTIKDVDDYNDYSQAMCEVVLGNRSAIMADALDCWKKSGLTKGQFIYALKDYVGYTEALTNFLCAAVHLSTQVIPDEDSALTE